MTFKIGDVVSLKSRGLQMTIEAINDGKIACVWSDGKKIYRDEFLAATLTEGDGSIEGFLERLDEADKKL